jgi:hypothetical protein
MSDTTRVETIVRLSFSKHAKGMACKLVNEMNRLGLYKSAKVRCEVYDLIENIYGIGFCSGAVHGAANAKKRYKEAKGDE